MMAVYQGSYEVKPKTRFNESKLSIIRIKKIYTYIIGFNHRTVLKIDFIIKCSDLACLHKH